MNLWFDVDFCHDSRPQSNWTGPEEVEEVEGVEEVDKVDGSRASFAFLYFCICEMIVKQSRGFL